MGIVLLPVGAGTDLDFTTYDGYLGSQGLIYHDDPEARAETRTLPLRPTRQDTGQNPWETRPESGDVFSQGDFRGGAGQTYFHHQNRDPSRFFSSSAFDIAEEGKLSHVYRTQRTLDWTSGGSQTIPASLIQLGGVLMASWGGKNTDPDHVAVHDGDFPGTWTTEDASDGETGGERPGATRFYPQTGAASVTPPYDSDFDQTYADTRILAKTKAGAATEVGTIPATQDPRGQIGLSRLVTETLKTGQTFSTGDTVSAVLACKNDPYSLSASYSAKLFLVIKVMASDNTTVRATLYQSPADGDGATWSSATVSQPLTTRVRTSTNLTASYTCVAGDYLVVDAGASFRRQATDDAATLAFETGGTSADHPLVDGATDDGVGWIEFSNTVMFASEATSSPIIYELATDGSKVYAAMGPNGIHQRSAAGVWSHYSDALAKHVIWAKDRLIAATDTSIYEIVAAGAAPTSLQTLPADWAYTDIWENGAYIYASAVNEEAGLSKIYHFGTNAAGTAIEPQGSTPMPSGELVYSGAGYLNQVFLGVGRRTEATGSDPLAADPVLYSATPDAEGFLHYINVASNDSRATGNRPIRAIANVTHGIYAAWQTEDFIGLALYDMARGAFSQHLQIPGASAGQVRITSVFVYEGRTIIAIPNFGVYYEDIGTYETEATLTTSIANWNNASFKAWTDIEIAHDPLPAGASVDVYYTTKHPDEDDWALAGTSNTLDSVGATFALSNVSSRMFALKLVSTRATDATQAPEIAHFSVRSHPRPAETEWVLTRYVRILAKDQKEGGSWVYQDPDEVRLDLMDTAYTSTTLYEPGVTWNVRVEQISDHEPSQPVYSDTSGTGDEEVYIMRLDFIGTRT
jgi:hypothetical protein